MTRWIKQKLFSELKSRKNTYIFFNCVVFIRMTLLRIVFSCLFFFCCECHIITRLFNQKIWSHKLYSNFLLPNLISWDIKLKKIIIKKRNNSKASTMYNMTDVINLNTIFVVFIVYFNILPQSNEKLYMKCDWIVFE